MDNVIIGNPLSSYLAAALTFVGMLGVLYLARYIILQRLQALALKTETDLDDFLVGLLGRIRAPEYHLIAFYIAARGLDMGGGFDKAFHFIFVLILSYRAATLLQACAVYGLRKAVGVDAQDMGKHSAMQSLRLLISVFIWIGAAIFFLDNLGINISTVVAGLGIGGVAVALAAQHILGDLFSSFVIFMDKPFRLGDVISSNGLLGTVESVGIKATRLRSLSGEIVVVPNKDLTSSCVSNFRDMTRRRVVLNFRLSHSTAHAKAAAVPEMIRKAVSAAPKTTFDRAHLSGLADTGLSFEAVYYVEDPDYAVFMQTQHLVDLALLERLQSEGISFAPIPAAVIH